MMKNVKNEIQTELVLKGIAPGNVYPQSELKGKYCDISDTFQKMVYKPDEGEKLRVHILQQKMAELVEKNNLSDNPICKENKKNIDDLASKIASTAAGAYGEKKAGEALKRLYSDHYMLHNVYLKNEAGAAEYDYIIITSKGIFIVEVKYSNWEIVIEENGDYLRMGDGKFNYHYNIVEAMEKKKYILWNALPDEIKQNVCIEHIHQLVLFVGDKRVINKVRWLKICYCSTVCHCIDKWYVEKYRLYREETKSVYDFLNTINSEALFPLDIDLEKMVNDFADTINLIHQSEAKRAKQTEVRAAMKANEPVVDRKEIQKKKPHIKSRISITKVTVAIAAMVVVSQIPRAIKTIEKYRVNLK